jgi:hypothetical protein
MTKTPAGKYRWKGTIDNACEQCRKHLVNREPTYSDQPASEELRHFVYISQLSPDQRVLTLREPYAWLVVNGYKDVENREWYAKFTGRILIHSAKTPDPSFQRVANWAGTHKGIVVPDREELEANNCGRVVGVANFGPMSRKPLESDWYQSGKNAWPIEWAFAIHPGPVVPGKQGFWFLSNRLAKLYYEQ